MSVSSFSNFSVLDEEEIVAIVLHTSVLFMVEVIAGPIFVKVMMTAVEHVLFHNIIIVVVTVIKIAIVVPVVSAVLVLVFESTVHGPWTVHGQWMQDVIVLR